MQGIAGNPTLERWWNVAEADLFVVTLLSEQWDIVDAVMDNAGSISIDLNDPPGYDVAVEIREVGARAQAAAPGSGSPAQVTLNLSQWRFVRRWLDEEAEDYEGPLDDEEFARDLRQILSSIHAAIPEV